MPEQALADKKPTTTTKPRHRESFRFPLPVFEITKYRETSVLGKRLPRAGIEKDIQDWLIAAAKQAMKDAGGVEGIMQKVLGQQ